MVTKRKRTLTEKARALLKTGAVLRDDSDDELGVEDHPWQWIYSGDSRDKASDDIISPKIVGARMGDFQCALGDTVLIKAAGKEAWVAMIAEFTETEDDDGSLTKGAKMYWFVSEREIRKKRMDCLSVCIALASSE